MTWLPEGRKSF